MLQVVTIALYLCVQLPRLPLSCQIKILNNLALQKGYIGVFCFRLENNFKFSFSCLLEAKYRCLQAIKFMRKALVFVVFRHFCFLLV